jgi:uncharacterized damage-inducible protein DinB
MIFVSGNNQPPIINKFGMKKVFLQYSAYHLWATQIILDRIKELPEEVIKTKVPSSFESLFTTIQHMWDAENIWWQRMKMQERINPCSEAFTGSFSELADSLMQQSKQWHDWVVAAQDHMLEHEFIYYNSKKEKFKQAVYLVLLQVFNHATYHRGQIINILRQLDAGNIPNTDFIAWSRKKTLVT